MGRTAAASLPATTSGTGPLVLPLAPQAEERVTRLLHLGDLAQACRDILANPDTSKGIPPQAWATARVRANEALGFVGQALSILEQLQ